MSNLSKKNNIAPLSGDRIRLFVYLCHMNAKFFFLFSILLVGALKTAAQPGFSRSHGVYEDDFIEVAINASGADEIHYTTDGSEPTTESPLYTGPLIFDATTVLRAVEVNTVTQQTSSVSTATYIFPGSVLSQPAHPEGYPDEWGPFCQISGTAPAYYEMYTNYTSDPAQAAKIRQSLYDLPILSLVTDRNHLFSHERDSVKGGIYIYTGTPVGDGIGRSWERPVSAELIGGPQGHDLTVDCGLVIHGGHGRLPEKNPKHSFRLKFKKEYGGKKTLHYDVFGDTLNAQFDQLVLRCHFGNSWQHWNNSYRQRAQYTRDLWARSTQKRMGHPAADGLYVHLFLNGLYWGLYNIAERIDDQFGKSHLGGSKSDIDVIKVEELGSGGNTIEASEGDKEAWDLMTTVAATADTDEGYYRLQGLNVDGEPDDALEALLDLDSFIDYMIINQYAGNNDWDEHNWIALRRRGAESTGFHFICWDTEQIFEGSDDNKLSLNHAGNPTGFFQTLMKNRMFLRRYMDHANDLLCQPGGLLTERGVRQVWDSLYNVIQNALYAEAARWGNYRRDAHPWQSRGSRYDVDRYYLSERTRLIDEYFPTRSATLLDALTKKKWFPKTEAPIFVVNGSEDIATDTLDINDELTLNGPFYMLFTFDGSQPVSWADNNSGEQTASAEFISPGNNLLAKLDAGTNGWVTFRSIGMRSAEWSATTTRRFFIVNTTGIANVQRSTFNAQGVYDLQGRRLSDKEALKPGIYIVNGKKVRIK